MIVASEADHVRILEAKTSREELPHGWSHKVIICLFRALLQVKVRASPQVVWHATSFKSFFTRVSIVHHYLDVVIVERVECLCLLGWKVWDDTEDDVEGLIVSLQVELCIATLFRTHELISDCKGVELISDVSYDVVLEQITEANEDSNGNQSSKD